MEGTLTKALASTSLANDDTKETIGRLLRTEFDRTEFYSVGCEMVAIANLLGVPQVDEMISDCTPDNFKFPF